MSSLSKHLNGVAFAGLRKVGDILIPGDDTLPKFSELMVESEIDRMVDYMRVEDREGLMMLLSLFATLPEGRIRWLLKRADTVGDAAGTMGETLRLINMGVKGVVYTLYFSDLTAGTPIRRGLGWHTKCGPDENEGLRFDALTPAHAFSLARAAKPQLRALAVAQRVEVLARLRESILRKQEWLVDEIVKATQKTRSDALMSEIFPLLDSLSYLEKSAAKVLQDRSVATPLALLGKSSEVTFEPLGVVLAIVPWNYPFYQAIAPAAAAIACGNPVVLKPSEHTPMRGVVEAVLADAKVPTGWLSIVYGDGAIGSELVEQKPDKIFFIGSSATGKKIMAQAAQHLIPVELELGGKDPMIVFPDANIERAVAGALWGSLTNSGQSCTSVERLYVQETIYEAFRERLVVAASRITVGADKDGSIDMGPMTVASQVQIVAAHVEDALSKGARALTGTQWNRKDRTIPAIVLENVSREMLVYNEETFGPVICLIPFRNEEEVIRDANDCAYGLSASVWSADSARCKRVARALDTGNVSINNVMLTEANPALPFGGSKQSGFGRYKGEFGLYSFSNIKSILTDSNSKKIEAHWYPFATEKYATFAQMMSGLFGDGATTLARFAKHGMALESQAQKLWNERMK